MTIIFQNDLSGYATPDDLLRPHTTRNRRRLTQLNLATTPHTSETAGDQAVQTGTLLQMATSSNRPPQPERDSEGRMIYNCDIYGKTTFHTRSAWK